MTRAIDEEIEVNLSPHQRTVRIGGASGFWGDSSVGAPQLVASGQIDYLVFDYLAELTMSILAAARQKNAALGYATDFVTVAMRAVHSVASAWSATPAASTRRLVPRHCRRWRRSRAWN